MKITILRLSLAVALLSVVLVLFALSIGDHLPGDHVAAFTTNIYRTRSMVVSDMQRHINLYLEFFGHDDDLPVWSSDKRSVIFYPRARDASSQQP